MGYGGGIFIRELGGEVGKRAGDAHDVGGLRDGLVTKDGAAEGGSKARGEKAPEEGGCAGKRG
jgi:hypothetical protein